MPRYRTTLRPAPWGGLPPGVPWRFVEAPQDMTGGPLDYLPRSRYRYGVIETDRPLTAKELRHFDIIEVD